MCWGGVSLQIMWLIVDSIFKSYHLVRCLIICVLKHILLGSMIVYIAWGIEPWSCLGYLVLFCVWRICFSFDWFALSLLSLLLLYLLGWFPFPVWLSCDIPLPSFCFCLIICLILSCTVIFWILWRQSEYFLNSLTSARVLTRMVSDNPWCSLWVPSSQSWTSKITIIFSCLHIHEQTSLTEPDFQKRFFEI